MTKANTSSYIIENIVIDKITGCWNWTANIDINGYAHGSYQIENKRERKAYHISFYIYNGYRASYICHTCDNKLCVNPQHLYEGSPKTNAEDRTIRERSSTRIGQSNGRSIVNEQLVLEIRRLYATKQYKQSELAEQFNIAQTTISAIVTYKIWIHI